MNGASSSPSHNLAWHLVVVGTTVTTHTAHLGHKEGGAAVVFSVIGLVVIISLVVFLGALSARRRTSDAPPGEKTRWRGGWGGGFSG